MPKSPDRLKCLAGTNQSACLINNDLYLWGLYGETKAFFKHIPTHIPFDFEIKDIKLGDLLVVILCTEGDVYTLGSNAHGQLGRKYREEAVFRKVPLESTIDNIAVGNNHVVAYNKELSRVYLWGSNLQGQIDVFRKEVKYVTPHLIEFDREVQDFEIHCGGNSTVLLCDKDNIIEEDLAMDRKLPDDIFKEIKEFSGKPQITKKALIKLKNLFFFYFIAENFL